MQPISGLARLDYRVGGQILAEVRHPPTHTRPRAPLATCARLFGPVDQDATGERLLCFWPEGIGHFEATTVIKLVYRLFAPGPSPHTHSR